MNTENLAKIEEIAYMNMQKARSSLLLDHPFFASFALKLELKVDSSCQDLWTDGKILAYNPLYAYSLSKEAMIGAQAHEIMHLACGHHVRRNNRDEKKWNEACDYAINYLLLEAGFKLPENFRHDSNHKDMSVDEIYEALTKFNDDEVHGGAKQANTAEEISNEDSEGSSGKLDAKSNEIKKENQNKNSSKDDESTDTSEAVQDLQAEDISNEESDGGKSQSVNSSFHGEVQDHPLLSDKDNNNAQKFAEERANIELAQAIQSAAFAGNTPLGLLRLFKENIAPSLDWRSLLQRFIENCSDGDYSWSSPNKRYIYQDIYLPARSEARIPSIALAIDASGSVDNVSLSLFCSELEYILDAYDTNLHILYHDNIVQGYKEYTRQDKPLALMPKGGGGTDYRPITKYIEENIAPKALIWFTDLECDLFPEEPTYPVLWISTKRQNYEPPYGEIIYIQ